MAAPQIAFITLTCLGLGINMAQHGKPKEGNENFFTSLIARGILYWGGFFS